MCPVVRMGISGKVRGMRAECPCPGGDTIQATPASPNLHQSPSLTIVTSKLTSDPSNRVRDKALLQPLLVVHAMSTTHVPWSPPTATGPTGNFSRKFQQTLTRLGHHQARTLPLPYPTAARRRGALSFPFLSYHRTVTVSPSRPFRLLPTCSQTASAP